MTAILNFMTANFWRHLSYCKPLLHFSLPDYVCSHPTTYGTVAVFSFFLCLFQIGQTAALLFWHDELQNSSFDYSEVPQSNYSYSSIHGQYHHSTAAGVEL
jgi:hypothetical protein